MIERHQNVSNMLQLAVTKYEDGNSYVFTVNISIFNVYFPVLMSTYNMFLFSATRKSSVIQLQILRANVYDYKAALMRRGPLTEMARQQRK
jgi:hypothetical protein